MIRKNIIIGLLCAVVMATVAMAQVASIKVDRELRDVRDPVALTEDLNASFTAVIGALGLATNNASLITSGNLALARLTNAVTTATGTLVTNTSISATGKTNTTVYVPIGGVYMIKSVSTSP